MVDFDLVEHVTKPPLRSRSPHWDSDQFCTLFGEHILLDANALGHRFRISIVILDIVFTAAFPRPSSELGSNPQYLVFVSLAQARCMYGLIVATSLSTGRIASFLQVKCVVSSGGGIACQEV